ncbi:MAG: hypothetical protein WBG30_09795 [Psychrilyobacter sp.]|uniref:hypothetical protein n=1 Tax=Psychrilyobacter sp. TaxID=2586924 RepID=UPI003C78BA9D
MNRKEKADWRKVEAIMTQLSTDNFDGKLVLEVEQGKILFCEKVSKKTYIDNRPNNVIYSK